MDAWYSVVLVLEEMDKGLRVLEKQLPQFFNGIVDKYDAMEKKSEHKIYF